MRRHYNNAPNCHAPNLHAPTLHAPRHHPTNILSDAKHFIQYFKKENVLYIMFRLRYFTTANEYKLMCQGVCLGQLYDVHNNIKISKNHWLGLRIYYDNNNIALYNTEVSVTY